MINKNRGEMKVFKVGDYIVCGHNGVCRVEKIGTLEASSSDRMFYTLTPVDDRNAQIFTPVDNNKMIMRYVMTKDEALDLIDSMKTLGDLAIPSEKKKEEAYKKILKSCDPKELAQMIKTIYKHRQSRRLSGKKEMVSDAKYYKLAKKQLYNELAAALVMDIENVSGFIHQRIESEI